MYKSVKAAAAYLGLSKWTVYRLVENKILPHVKISTKAGGYGPKSKVVIDEKDLERYARRNRVMSNEEFIAVADRKLLEMERAREERIRRMR